MINKQFKAGGGGVQVARKILNPYKNRLAMAMVISSAYVQLQHEATQRRLLIPSRLDSDH